MELDLPDPYVARPYRGAVDHPTIVDVLANYREHSADQELPTVEQLDVTYANLTNCDPDTDIAIIETVDGEPVAYARASWEPNSIGGRDCVVFSPIKAAHLQRPLFDALVAGQERHMRAWAEDVPNSRYRAYAVHPGPDQPPIEEAAWLELGGYAAIRFGAGLLRPNLHDIPDRQLPAGVELRAVDEADLRTIFDAHWECFRGDWDFRESTEQDFNEFRDNPLRDTSLWKIAWAGGTVVGQVKTFVNPEENAQRGYLRGYTEYISTHRDWRNQGIAGTLLAMSLTELRNRGYNQAALGVDTENPGGALHLYTSLGFELYAYEAVYAKPID